MFNWLADVDGLDTFIDVQGHRSFRLLENSVNNFDITALTEFEHAFVYHVKGYEASRYFSFVELGQDINVAGVSDMSLAELTARVAELPYATVTGKYTLGDSFQVDQAAVTTRRSPEPQSSQESDQDEERTQAEPPWKRRRTAQAVEPPRKRCRTAQAEPPRKRCRTE